MPRSVFTLADFSPRSKWQHSESRQFMALKQTVKPVIWAITLSLGGIRWQVNTISYIALLGHFIHINLCTVCLPGPWFQLTGENRFNISIRSTVICHNPYSVIVVTPKLCSFVHFESITKVSCRFAVFEDWQAPLSASASSSKVFISIRNTVLSIKFCEMLWLIYAVFVEGSNRIEATFNMTQNGVFPRFPFEVENC